MLPTAIAIYVMNKDYSLLYIICMELRDVSE